MYDSAMSNPMAQLFQRLFQRWSPEQLQGMMGSAQSNNFFQDRFGANIEQLLGWHNMANGGYLPGSGPGGFDYAAAGFGGRAPGAPPPPADPPPADPPPADPPPPPPRPNSVSDELQAQRDANRARILAGAAASRAQTQPTGGYRPSYGTSRDGSQYGGPPMPQQQAAAPAPPPTQQPPPYQPNRSDMSGGPGPRPNGPPAGSGPGARPNAFPGPGPRPQGPPNADSFNNPKRSVVGQSTIY